MDKKVKKQNSPELNLPKIIAFSALAVLVLFFIVCQVYLTNNQNSITTEIAILDTERKTISVDMFVVRDEEILTSSGNSIVSAVKDGTRVSVNDTVAYSFSDSSSAANVMRLAEIEEELEYYNSLMNKSSYITDNTTAYDNKISASIADFSAAVASGNFSNLDELQDNLRDTITSKQTATGVELDLSDTISELNAEAASLRSSAGKYTEIKAGTTGYYISGVDGYENLLDFNAVDDWTISNVENAMAAVPQTASANQFGKLMNGYYWYLVCITDTNKINSLKEGKRNIISFPDSSVNDITCEIHRISSDAESGKSMIVFKCNSMSQELSVLRNEQAYIVLQEYEGYRVDNRAIRTNEDNETGVYVVKGSTLKFKKVEIIYSDDDYSLVSNPYLRGDEDAMANTSKSSYLAIYDEYVVSGKDLYDGKIIN